MLGRIVRVVFRFRWRVLGGFLCSCSGAERRVVIWGLRG